MKSVLQPHGVKQGRPVRVKHDPSQQKTKLNENRGKFLNFSKIEGKFTNFVEIGGICNMHH